MYNPYNWDIMPRKSRYELWNETMGEITKLYAEKSIAMLAIQLSIMNLQDSLQYELDNNELCSNTKHDIEDYSTKIKKYKGIVVEIEHKEKILSNIY